MRYRFIEVAPVERSGLLLIQEINGIIRKKEDENGDQRRGNCAIEIWRTEYDC